MNRIYSSRQRPFGAIPDTRFYFPHQSIQSALDTIVRAMTRSEGPVAVLGGSGYGKSLLAELACEALCERLDIVKLQSARICSRQALLQNILYELQLPYRSMSEGELRLSILDRLEPSPETAPEGVMIVVDEAHTLHAKLLDELRLLTNFSRNNQVRVRLLLLGNMRLEETLASPTLESLNQRLAARCYLQPMNREESFEYVRHQLRMSGRNPEACITADALRAVYSASDGIPRLVNQVMDHTLVMAAQQGCELVTAALVNDSWAEMQQLPTPWTVGKAEFSAVPQGIPIEFGLLDDSLDEPEYTTGNRQNICNQDDAIIPEELAIGEQLVVSTQSCESPDCCEFQGSEDHPGSREGSNPGSSEPAHNFFSAFSELALVEGLNVNGQSRCLGMKHVADCQLADNSPAQSSVAELRAYDAMGLWENDPPLRDDIPSSIEAESAVRLDSQVDSESEERTEELFGTDFDLEEVVPSQGTLCSTSSCSESDSEKWSRHFVPENEDYLVRLQQASDRLYQVQQFDNDLETKVLLTQPNVSSERSSSDSDPQWSISVCADTSRGRMEESIEDIVSQLNFSAFMIEPFSVEQIPLRVDCNPGKSHDQCGDHEEVELGVRVSDQQEVVMLHRPLESSGFFEGCEDFDDDRDLLIIEEHIGGNSQTLLQNLPNEPAQKPSPYQQLFSRLRR